MIFYWNYICENLKYWKREWYKWILAKDKRKHFSLYFVLSLKRLKSSLRKSKCTHCTKCISQEDTLSVFLLHNYIVMSMCFLPFIFIFSFLINCEFFTCNFWEEMVSTPIISQIDIRTLQSTVSNILCCKQIYILSFSQYLYYDIILEINLCKFEILKMKYGTKGFWVQNNA